MNSLRLSSVQRRLRRMLSQIVLLLAIVPDARADNRRWNDGTGSGVFNAPGNWVGGVAPGVLDVVQFGRMQPPSS